MRSSYQGKARTGGCDEARLPFLSAAPSGQRRSIFQVSVALLNCTCQERLASLPSGPQSSGPKQHDWAVLLVSNLAQFPFRSPLSPDFNCKPSSLPNTHLDLAHLVVGLVRLLESSSLVTLISSLIWPATSSRSFSTQCSVKSRQHEKYQTSLRRIPARTSSLIV